jgi:enamine deaminase RidA (YjgF/YER057c/UK114 family)
MMKRLGGDSAFEQSAGYSRGVDLGDRVLVSGSAPVGPDGTYAEDAGAQVEHCFARVRETLQLAGLDLEDIVLTRMYVADRAAVDDIVAAHGRLMGACMPASTLVLVSGLYDPAWKVEIEVEAHRPESKRSVRRGADE